MTITLCRGDNRISLAAMLDNSVDSVVTDPPYGLVSIQKRFGKKGAAPARSEKNDGSFARLSGGFMGKAWDSTGIENDPTFWAEVLRVLKPGGYIVAFSASRTYHRMAVAIEDAGFITHPMIGWLNGCLDRETECLTRRGWLNHTEILPTDQVLQWDAEADVLSWTTPSAIHEYDFEGNLCQIKNRHTHQMLTPNHRVYAKIRRHSRHQKPSAYEIVYASEIQNRSTAWQVDLPMASELRGGDEIDTAFAYLVGWWLTDAWPHKDANACCFSQSKPRTLAKLRNALSGLGASEYVKTAKKSAHNDEHSFYLTGHVADRLRKEFPRRQLAWEVLGWSFEARRALYEGLMDGDGSRDVAGQRAEAFWSQRQDRRDVFLALALSIGIRCYEDADNDVVHVNPKTKTTQISSRHLASEVSYTGKVWCLSVPTGAFVVRRSGRPFITGNSGFPKAHAADKAIDKHLGAEGRVVPTGAPVKRMIPGADQNKAGWEKNDGREYQPGTYMPATDEAAQWEGWAYGGQVRKPALEPIYVGQKPFSEKTGAANILKWGVGAVNVDGCRVPTTENLNGGRYAKHGSGEADGSTYGSGINKRRPGDYVQPEGRHPANLIHDGSPEVVALFPHTKSGKPGVMRKGTNDGACYGAESRPPGTQMTGTQMTGFGDEGSAARFFECYPFDDSPAFYQPKAGKEDRAGGKHPTVKPIALMAALVRHVTPLGGTVLDPFAGSGTTAVAAQREGMNCILMEAESEYIAFLEARFGLGVSSTDLSDLLS